MDCMQLRMVVGFSSIIFILDDNYDTNIIIPRLGNYMYSTYKNVTILVGLRTLVRVKMETVLFARRPTTAVNFRKISKTPSFFINYFYRSKTSVMVLKIARSDVRFPGY